MKISHGDFSLKFKDRSRRIESEQRARSSKTDSGEIVDIQSGKSSKIRQQLIQIQAQLSKYQTMLGGLHGFRSYVDAKKPASEAVQYLAGITYDQEAVLEPYRERLLELLAESNGAGLDQITSEVEAQIKTYSSSIDHFNIAEQNRQAVLSEFELEEIVAGIKEGIPFEIERDKALDFLI